MEENKRVLIITYYWPPSAGSGVQRWLKFAKYLPDYGWDPLVFTPENPDFELRDESLVNKIPSGLEVLKFPIWEPYGILKTLKRGKLKDPALIIENKDKSLLDKFSIWLRANLIVPDPRVFWKKPSSKFLLDIIDQNGIKAVITTGPPHSMHLIGRELKRKKGLVWLADFRDPWSTWEFLDTLPMLGIVRRMHEKLEQSVLKEADIVVTISPTFKEELEKIGRRKVDLITNGFDPADLPSNSFDQQEKEDAFHIVYVGIIDAIRDPVPFLKAFKAAFAKREKKVRLTFVGKVSTPVQDFIQSDPWLEKQVEMAGYLSHEEVFPYYKKADLLLLILTHTKNAKGNIPGKLFEYLATGKTILALGDPQGDSAYIIREADGGQVFLHDSIENMSKFLIEQTQISRERSVHRGIEKFERKFLTGQLAVLLDEKVNPLS